MSDPHYDDCSDRIPLGYLITFRSHGTWLHGDSRGSVDRFRNRYGTPRIPADQRWERYNERIMKIVSVELYTNVGQQLTKRSRKLAPSAGGSYGRETLEPIMFTLWSAHHAIPKRCSEL